MVTEIKQRERYWGVFCLGVLMFVLTLAGKPGAASPYALYWLYVCYLAFRGRAESIIEWTRLLVWINATGFVLFLLFVDSDSSLIPTLRFHSKGEFLIAILIPLVIKLGLLFALRHKVSPNRDFAAVLMGPLKGERSSSPANAAPGVFKDSPQLTKTASVALHQTHQVKPVPERQSSDDGQGKTVLLEGGNLKNSNSIDRYEMPSDDELWSQALTEYDSGEPAKGLYARAFAESGGDEVRTKAEYLKWRFEQLRAQAQEKKTEADRIAHYALNHAAEGALRDGAYTIDYIYKSFCYLLPNGQAALLIDGANNKKFRLYEDLAAAKLSAKQHASQGTYLLTGFIREITI